MKKLILSLCLLPFVAGCNTLQLNSTILGGKKPVPEATGQLGEPLTALSPEATAEVEDVESGEGMFVPLEPERPSFSGQASTVAGLGDPSIPGLWMETPLVTAEQKAKVRSANGTEVVLTLKPIPGEPTAGSRLSIGAMRALGLPLTELAEVQVLPAG